MKAKPKPKTKPKSRSRDDDFDFGGFWFTLWQAKKTILFLLPNYINFDIIKIKSYGHRNERFIIFRDNAWCYSWV